MFNRKGTDRFPLFVGSALVVLTATLAGLLTNASLAMQGLA